MFLSEKMNQARANKDQDLAAAQKAADEKTALAEQKLALVGKLEEENTRLKTTLDEANKEATRLKKDKRAECTYCQYRAICKFDLTYRNNKYRQI